MKVDCPLKYLLIFICAIAVNISVMVQTSERDKQGNEEREE